MQILLMFLELLTYILDFHHVGELLLYLVGVHNNPNSYSDLELLLVYYRVKLIYIMIFIVLTVEE